MSKTFKNFHWLWLSLGIIIIDHITKLLALAKLTLHQPVSVLPFFNFTLIYNKGAAFGFLNSAAGWQRWLFAAVAILVSAIILRWLYRLPAKQTGSAVALSLILGGALGNLWDRIYFGYVIDFFDFHIKNWHFPAFNIADSAITIGAIILIIDILRKR